MRDNENLKHLFDTTSEEDENIDCFENLGKIKRKNDYARNIFNMKCEIISKILYFSHYKPFDTYILIKVKELIIVIIFNYMLILIPNLRKNYKDKELDFNILIHFRNMHFLNKIFLFFSFIFFIYEFILISKRILENRTANIVYNNIFGLKVGNIGFKNLTSKLVCFQNTLNSTNYKDFDIRLMITANDDFYTSIFKESIVEIKNLGCFGYTRFLEVIFKYIIKFCLFCYQKRIDYGEKNTQWYIFILKTIIIFVTIFTFFLSPLISVCILFYNVIKSIECIYTEPDQLFSKEYDLVLKVKQRKYSELKHEYKRRIRKSHIIAENISQHYTSKNFQIISSLFSFIISCLIFLFICLFINSLMFKENSLSLSNQNVFSLKISNITIFQFDFLNIFYIIGFLAVLLNIFSKRRQNKKSKSHLPKLFKKWEKILNMESFDWNGRENSEFVKTEFLKIYEHKVFFVIREIFAPYFVPYQLLILFSHLEPLFKFIESSIVYNKGYITSKYSLKLYKNMENKE